MPLSPNAEINRTMLTRLANALAKCGRAMVRRRPRLFRETCESGHGVDLQPCLVRAMKRVDDRPLASTRKEENLKGSDFSRTQSQLMETMLRSMILASGWSVDGSGSRDGLKPER